MRTRAKRNQQIHVWMSHQEIVFLEYLAKKKDLSKADVLRRLLRTAYMDLRGAPETAPGREPGWS